MQAMPEAVKSWLDVFSRAVRERDFAAGRELFDDAVVSFGTVCPRAENLEQLVMRQWQPVWSKTADFNFDFDRALAVVDGNLATVFAEWKSTDFDGAQAPFPRRGRATIVLKKFPPGWKAVHTHFSLVPPGSPI